MKVYKPSLTSPNHTLFVSPGVDYPETCEWVDESKKPKTFSVCFKYGIADVNDQLGHYLIDKSLASASPLISMYGTPL